MVAIGYPGFDAQDLEAVSGSVTVVICHVSDPKLGVRSPGNPAARTTNPSHTQEDV
jgi:hypothetical protein